jgi:hypothetical protein
MILLTIRSFAIVDISGSIAMHLPFSRKPVLSYYVLVIVLMALLINPAYPQQPTIASQIPVPNGFVRKSFPQGTFSNWVQNLPLKKSDRILAYNGSAINDPDHNVIALYNVFAVVDMPLLFKSDIEQCADYCMRFWAEYHKSLNKLDKLYLFDYNGNKKLYSSSGKSWTGFLKWAFSYSNSFSLKKGCAAIKETDVIPGDMFVQNEGGGIGHVSMVVDIAESKDGKKLYCIGFGFMPAQEFHIEKAEDKYGQAGWFTVEGFYQYLADFLALGKPVLRRFAP